MWGCLLKDKKTEPRWNAKALGDERSRVSMVHGCCFVFACFFLGGGAWGGNGSVKVPCAKGLDVQILGQVARESPVLLSGSPVSLNPTPENPKTLSPAKL